MPTEWIVLLEFVRAPSSPEVDIETLSRLLDHLGDRQPVALRSPDRYAVQLHLLASDPQGALAAGFSAWSEALSTVGVAPWELVRAEVMTGAELANELSLAVAADVLAGQRADDVLDAAFDDLVSGLAGEQGPHALAADLPDVRWRLLLQGSSEVVTVVSADGTVVFSFAPQGASAITGERWNATTFTARLHPDDAEVVRDALAQALARPHQPVPFTARFGEEHQWRWYESVATNLLEEPLIGGIVVNSRDVTDTKHLLKRLADMTVCDELTGLANRAAFLDKLELALARSTATSHIAVFFVDIDNFRGFVDSHGTPAGEQLLMAVAERLTTGIRGSSTAARLGGDEFALLCEGISNHTEAAGIATQIGKVLGAPVVTDGNEVSVGVSVGGAIGTPGMLQPATLLRHAEVAMYRARRGHQRYELYRKDRQSRSSPELPPLG